MQQAIRGTCGTRLIADSLAALQAMPTVPTVFIWPNIRRNDPQYDANTGAITIAEDSFFSSSANWATSVISGTGYFYADAEFYVNGEWVRGLNSCRREYIRNGDQQRTTVFPFDGFFPAGTILRFVAWASGSNVVISTSTDQGSTIAAARLTYATIAGKIRE